MMSTPLLLFLCFIATMLAAVFMIGEALALWVGTTAVQKGHPWLTRSNKLLLVADIITGGFLLALMLLVDRYFITGLFLFFTGAGLVTHLYRVYEYFRPVEQKFCGNLPLFLFNGIKILFLLTAMGSSIIFLNFFIR